MTIGIAEKEKKNAIILTKKLSLLGASPTRMHCDYLKCKMVYCLKANVRVYKKRLDL